MDKPMLLVTGVAGFIGSHVARAAMSPPEKFELHAEFVHYGPK